MPCWTRGCCAAEVAVLTEAEAEAGAVGAQVGAAAAAGLAVVLLLIPLNRWLALKIQSTSNALMAAKDCRLKRMGELLSGIRQIKTAAWEPAFAERVRVRCPFCNLAFAPPNATVEF